MSLPVPDKPQLRQTLFHEAGDLIQRWIWEPAQQAWRLESALTRVEWEARREQLSTRHRPTEAAWDRACEISDPEARVVDQMVNQATLVYWELTEGVLFGDALRAAFTTALSAAKLSEANEASLDPEERAELELLRDLKARVIGFGGDDYTLMPWIDAHRLHADEPYIGCPFCRDKFVPLGGE